MLKSNRTLRWLFILLTGCGSLCLGVFFFTGLQTAGRSAITAANRELPQPAVQKIPGKKLKLRIGDQTWNLSSQAATIGELLSELKLNLHPGDKIFSDPRDPVKDGAQLTILKARQLWVERDGNNISGISAAATVGQALADLGISLQGMDFSQPAEDAPVPEDGRVRVIRVHEKIELIKEETPANYSYQADPETELDQQSTLVAAVPGYLVTRSRSLVIDGKEQEPSIDGRWKASDPQDGIIGLGSKVVVHTETVEGVELNYWRKLSVYATGYKPSSNGGTGTASGIPLTKGIIAVDPSWYKSGMAFQKVYVPGYGFGTIADTGKNILGHPWIDLGFDDDNYVSWHHWTTLYLLEPVPAFVPLQMP